MRKIILPLLILLCSCAAFAQDVDNTPDPVVTLRNQIEVAANDSDRIRLQLKLADLLLSTGHKTQALAELSSIANSNAFDPIGFYNLGNAYARLGETEAAITAYRKAIQQRNGRYSRALNNVGVMLLRTGRWDEAQEALVSALQFENFRYAEASYNLGRVYSARGQKDLAAREWRRALTIDPQHDGAKQALASVGTEERIVVASSRKSEEKPGAVSTKAGPTPAPSTKPLQLDPASFDYLQRARNASERGKMPEAVDNFRRVLSRQGGYFPPANLELSYVLLSLKRYDEALTNLLEVSKRDGARYPISYFHLARLYERNGELKLAEAAFAQAAPGNTQFLLDLSRVREKLGDYKGSLEAMERYLKLMQEQGQKPDWSDQRLAELRTKASKQ
ncbi:MAG TPA: tetratricopeptide repeat protein [Pyrinomonadaceae bacterium]|nr:tetratricopeptide repeat protein [Pyrinomonadaceae bacterium]